MVRITTALLLACTLALPAWAEETATAEAAKAELGKKSPEIRMTDTAGRSFVLHDNRIVRKDAEAAVRAVAAQYGAPKDAALSTKVADLSGVQDDGEVDTDKVLEMVRKAGEFFGLAATESSLEGLGTLADVVEWIAKADTAPILLMTWSPKCPTTGKLNERIIETIASLGLRAYAVACNTRDTDEMYEQFRDAHDFPLRIFPDREQKVTDILGGRTTPHFFLFDHKGVLQYRGGLDNDPMGFMDDEERQDYIADAATAIRAGTEVEVKETEPAGWSVKRAKPRAGSDAGKADPKDAK